MMKNKILLFSFIILLTIFSIINGRYTFFALITYFTSFLLINKNLKENKIKYLFFSLFFVCFEVLLMKYVLENFISNIILKNIFSTLYIVFYTYVFSDIKLVIKIIKFIKHKSKKLSNFWSDLINNKKFLWFLPNNVWVFLFFILSIFTFVTFSVNDSNDYYNVFIQPDGEEVVDIKKDTKIDLDFIDTEESFSNICFKFGTYGRKNTSNLTFVVNSDKKNIIKEKFNTSSLVDGEYKCFNIGNISLKKLKSYDMYFSPDSKVKAGNTVAIFKQKKTGNVSLALAKSQKNNVNIFKVFLIIYGFIIFIVINYIVNSKKISCEKFYIYTLLFMVPILFIIPALNVPDEFHHFYRAYSSSQIIDDNFKYNGLENRYTKVPKNIDCLNYSKVQVANKVYDINDISKCTKEEKNTVIFNTYAGITPIFGYIPQTIGIKIADIFSNSPIIIFYFGRILSFVVSFLIAYAAIKITPKYKRLFLLVATMMMFVQQIISYSYDSILNSMALLYVASILKLICGKNKIKTKDFILPFISLIVILNIKIVYFPLAILMFFIPKEKFKKNKWLCILLYFIFMILLLKGIDYIIALNVKDTGIVDNSASKQLAYLINNPLHIFKVIYNTIRFNTVFYIRGLVGYFSWFSFKVNDLYFIIYLVLFLYVIFSEKNIISTKQRLILLISILISVIGIFGAMYLLWSGYKLSLVEGVQGRYFIPLIVPTFICFIPKKIKIKKDDKFLYSAINVLLLQLILVLIVWYY